MKLAFSTNAYLRFPFAEAVTRLAKIGYGGVEIMADVPHAWPAYLLPGQKQAIRSALKENRLAISNINAFMMHAVDDPRQKYWHPSWIEPDLHYRRIRVEHTKKALTLAKELGARCVTTEPGGPLAPGQTFSDGLEIFARELAPILDHAEREGVMLLIEPEPGLLLETVDQYLELRKLLRSPAMGLNFDIGHSYCVSEDPAEAIKKAASHIKHFHLEDIAASRIHHHLVPGDGAIDFGPVIQSIRNIGYDDWITVELYPYADNPDEAATTAFERVSKLLA